MNYLKLYADFLKKYLKLRKPLRVVFDCSNGTTGKVLKELFGVGRQVSRQVFFINDKPDGRFPAHGPDPMHKGALKDLQRAVKKHQADLGVIFDADGDRAFFVDDAGRAMHPDAAAALISKNFKGPVVLDLRTGYLTREILAADKKKFFESRVGTYFMKKLMKEKNADFGAEVSGHYYFALRSLGEGGPYFDSGILAAIYMIRQLTDYKFIDSLPKYYRSGEINFVVRDKAAAMALVEKKYKSQAEKISHLDGLKMEFEEWWFNLRPSNTEDLLRLNLESKNRKIFTARFAEIKKILKLAS